MHDIEAMCNEHGRQILLIWFINYLPSTKFHIVNRGLIVFYKKDINLNNNFMLLSQLHNLFLNGILAGASGTLFLVPL